MNCIFLLFNFFFFISTNTFELGLKSFPFSTGKELFQIHCLSCHQKNGNSIIPEKNLKKETLESNGMTSISAISYQILNGKNGMPAFGDRLQENEIEQIASYVLEQAEKKR
jgi:cytochrome c6